MISVNKRLLYGEVYNDVRCLSTDEKPVDDIRNGSTLVEIDTGTVYMFDAIEKAWNEMPKGGGGGGGGVESFNGRHGAVRSRAGDYTASQVDTSTSGKTVQAALDELEPDAALSSTSTHPVQNKVIKAKLDEIEEEVDNYSPPEMTTDTRGGAKLEQHGGLTLRDGALGIGSLVQESDGYARGGLAQVTAKGHAEQDGTPTPDSPVEIQVVRGRNLIDTTVVTSGKYLASGGTVTDGATYSISDYVPIEAGVTYVTSGMGAVSSAYYAWYNASKTYISATQQTANDFTLTAPANAAYVRVSLLNASLGTSQLEVGSTPQPYVPYGHVGMEARDPDTDELISCTALPLPSRGWVGSLPDGTADSLRLDGAGKCEWELKTSELMLDGSENWNNNNNSGTSNWYHECTQFQTDWPQTTNILVSHYVGAQITNSNTSNGLWCVQTTNTHDHNIRIRYGTEQSKTDFATWLSTHNVTILYPVENPTTESGYIDLPSIGGNAIVTIPELDELGICYFVDDTVTQYGREIIARVKSEYEDRLTALEQAVAELATS